MPVGTETGWEDGRVWTAAEILSEARAFAELIPVTKSGERRHGPARMFDIEGGLGRIGIISPYTDHFCSTCNRLRITSDGNLRTCLFSDRVYRLRPALRHPALGMEQVEKIIRLAGKNKPIGNELLRRMRASDHGVCKTRMASIGG
jgi:cyclic pyranopterin phosphate synthase